MSRFVDQKVQPTAADPAWIAHADNGPLKMPKVGNPSEPVTQELPQSLAAGGEGFNAVAANRVLERVAANSGNEKPTVESSISPVSGASGAHFYFGGGAGSGDHNRSLQIVAQARHHLDRNSLWASTEEQLDRARTILAPGNPYIEEDMAKLTDFAQQLQGLVSDRHDRHRFVNGRLERATNSIHGMRVTSDMQIAYIAYDPHPHSSWPDTVEVGFNNR